MEQWREKTLRPVAPGVSRTFSFSREAHPMRFGARIQDAIWDLHLEEYEIEQTSRPNPCPFGTSGMSPADSASRAGGMPEASGDSSSGTFAKIMSLRSHRLSDGMRPDSSGTMIPHQRARVRVRAERLAGTQLRCDGTRLRVNPEFAKKPERGSTALRAQYISRCLQREVAEGSLAARTGRRGIQDRRPVRMKRKCEQTSRGNPYRPSRLMLRLVPRLHHPRRPSGAPHWGRSRIISRFATMNLRGDEVQCGRSDNLPRRYARIRVLAGRLAGTQRRCDGTKLRMNQDPAVRAATRSHRPTSTIYFPSPSTRGVGRITTSKDRKQAESEFDTH
jgi:hypothetical protein